MHRFSRLLLRRTVSSICANVRMIFGSKFYNRNYGLIFIGYGIGAFVGPKISAYFYDTTGQYTMGFIGSAVLAVAAHRTDRDRTERWQKRWKMRSKK